MGGAVLGRDRPANSRYAAPECSGGGYALVVNGSRFAEIPNEERPYPPAGSEEDPTVERFASEIVDNGGQNPPNQDAYQMTLFDAAANVVYEYGDLITVRRGNLRVDVEMQQTP